MKKICIVFCLLCWIAKDVNAQNNTVATGGTASGSGGSETYSVGQIDYISNTGSGGVMTEGVQQPFEIFVTGIDEPTTDNLNATAFPNPATNYVELRIIDAINGPAYYELYDLSGKSIEKNEISQDAATINVMSLACGTYLLRVTVNNNLNKTFKINVTK